MIRFAAAAFTAASFLSAAAAHGAGRSAMGDAPLTATGNFKIEMKPAAAMADGVARFTMSKTWSGAMSGSSTGEMLAGGDPKSGSAGYVAIELFKGRVDGREGGFALQQQGLMQEGKPDMRVVVTPGSGTGALAGISGEMTIDPAHDHAYVLTYRLPR